ncbi:hypothetical protein F4703DRAFT_1740040 [Phycomyces blakesleeanus]
MEQIYDVLFFKITQQELAEDTALSEAVDSMFQLDFIQVGLPPILGAKKRVTQAIAEFERIGSYRTPADKLDSLLTTISRLTDDSQQGLDSDSLIPLMLLTIIRSRAPHLRANLNYMKDYSFERNTVTGQYGYALITLESVLDYIIDAHRPLNTIYDARDHKGNNALMLACRGGHVQTVEYVLSVREPINAQDLNDSKETPLMMALEAQSIKTVKLLLKDPFVVATIDHVSDTQKTSLILASRIQDPVFVKLLVGADLDVVNLGANGPSFSPSSSLLSQEHITKALYAACLANCSDVIRYLLKFNPRLDLPNDRGETFFHLCRDSDIVRELLSVLSKPDLTTNDTLIQSCVDALDSQKRTPLLVWAAKGRPDLVELFVPVANPDRLDCQGRSGLHLLSMVRWKIPANTNSKFVLSRCIHDLVKKLGHLMHLADWADGNTAVHLAAQTMNLRPQVWITELVRQGADLTRVNRFLDRPLNLWRGTDRSFLQGNIYIYIYTYIFVRFFFTSRIKFKFCILILHTNIYIYLC